MHDFKRKTAKMPHFDLSPSTISLSEELDEIGDLQCRVLARILQHNDNLDQKTTWACNEIAELSHVQTQLITANNNHADKIDGIEKREIAYNASLAAYRNSITASVKVLILIGSALCGVVAWGVTWGMNHFFKP